MKKTSKNYSNIHAAGLKKIEGRTAVTTESNQIMRRAQVTKNEKTSEAEMKGENTMKKTTAAAAAAKTEPKTIQTPPQGTIEGPAQNEKYMWLNNAVLQINPAIQRKISPMRVDAIVRHFSPNVANPIKVSFRDGKFYIFDGMHTREALCILNGTDDFPIFCRVYYGLTVEDEARLFAAQFGFSESVSMGYRLRALAVAKDPEVLDFLKVTKECGLNISLGSHTGRNGNIAATCAAFKAYRALGSAGYGRMLTMLHRTWAGDSWSINRYMISGMARFMKMYEVNTLAFVKAFREVTYDEIVVEAARFAGMSKDGAFAAAFADIYERNSQYPLKESA